MVSSTILRALLCLSSIPLIHCGPGVFGDNEEPETDPPSSGSEPTPTPVANGTPTATPQPPGTTPTPTVTPTEAPPLDGEGPLSINPGRLDFGTVPLGCTREKSLLIANEGDALITVTDLVFSSGLGLDFDAPIPAAAIDPGDSVSLPVVFKPQESQQPEGTLVVLNDSEPSSYAIPVTGGTALSEAVVDAFGQVDPKLDILLLLDTSGSMLEEHQSSADALAEVLGDLLAQGLDYHVGIVTYELFSQGQLQGTYGSEELAFVTRGMGEAGIEELHASIVDMTSGGLSTDERGFDTLQLATSPEAMTGANAGFFREGVPLSLVTLTDEDDHSLVRTPALVEHLDAQFGLEQVSAGFLVSLFASESGCGAEVAQKWIDLAEALGNSVEDVCALNRYGQIYASYFEAIGLDLRDTFVLSEVPATPDSLVVEVASSPSGDPSEVTGWRYDPLKNAVVFEPGAIPRGGSQVLITYLPESLCN